MTKLDDAVKTGEDVRFTALGRELADRVVRGIGAQSIVDELQLLRRLEQDRGSKAEKIAALARQIGDAARNSKPLETLVARLVELRRMELGG
jgi:glucose-6-phosphate-specific signal transduction histidine kinase